MAISAKQVQELRAKTGAGIMDCKKALGEANGDFDGAVETLRKSGLAASAKKAGRIASEGLVGSYIHGGGKIGVLVGLKSEGDKDQLMALGKQLSMHIAATNPQAATTAELDPAIVEKERTFLIEQAKESGKTQEIAEKMVEGRIRKFFSEVVLAEQTFVIDNETKISKVIENAAKEIGSPIELVGFARLELGEGIEKKEEDFAAEVAAVAAS